MNAGLLVALIAACAIAAPAVATEPTLVGARAATAQRDFATALPIFEALLARTPDDADLLIEAARVHGFADRNAAAAALYRRALAVAPQRRGDIVPSLAWQALWGGDAAGAAPLFLELATSTQGEARADPLDGLAQARLATGDLRGALNAWDESLALRPDDVGTARRRALALLWADRHDEAIAALEALQRRHPQRREIGWTLANARNLAGAHRRAIAEFEALGPPRGAAERRELARAWRWAGDPQQAAALLGDEAATDRDLARELSRQQWARVEHAVDRDDLESVAMIAGAGWHPAPGVRAEFGVRRLALDDPSGAPTSIALQGLLRWRLGGATDAAGIAWPSLALRLQRIGDWTPVTGSARVTWLPRDRWRLDADVQRELIETPMAIAERVHVDSVSFGVDHRPDARWTLTGGLAALRFDDGNLRTRLTLRAERALSLSPRWVAGVEAMRFVASDPTGPTVPGRGYWNPRSYAEWRAYTGLAWSAGPWHLDARLGVGRSDETDGFGNASRGRPHQWSMGLAYDATPALRLHLALGGAGSGFGAAGGPGYWRRHASLGAEGWF